MARPRFTSGSLLADIIEPDTSSRKTRLRGGTLSARISCPWMPIRTSLCCAFQGHDVTSVLTAKGAPPEG
jgi:hypothetical protein